MQIMFILDSSPSNQVPVCLHKNSLADISLIQTHQGLYCDGSFDSIQCEWHKDDWRKDAAAFTLTILLSHIPEGADGVETLLKTGDNKASALAAQISDSWERP